MTNPIIIFARSPESNGAWGDFKRCAIAHDGRLLTSHSMNGAVIILADNTEPLQMTLVFDQGYPVFGVEHAGTPPNDRQRAEMAKWPQYRCVASFHHDPGNSHFYESLKVLLEPSSTDARRQEVVADILNRCSADAEWLVLNEFAIVQQIKLLAPQSDTTVFETAIKALGSGAEMFDALEDGQDTAEIINDEIKRLSASCTG